MLRQEQIREIADDLINTSDNNFMIKIGYNIKYFDSKDLFDRIDIKSNNEAAQFWRQVLMDNEKFDCILAKHKVCYINETIGR